MPDPLKRDRVTHLRLTVEEYDRLVGMATVDDVSVSHFLRRLINKETPQPRRPT
jgi:hypothetical protein